MCSSHSDPHNEIAATVVVVAVESAPSSFSVLVVVGITVVVFWSLWSPRCFPHQLYLSVGFCSSCCAMS